MNTVLLFFALPVATIIIAAVFQKCICHSPCAIAAFLFAIYLILTYAVFGTDFLIFALVYALLAYVSALITRFIQNLDLTSDDNSGNDNGCGCRQHGRGGTRMPLC